MLKSSIPLVPHIPLLADSFMPVLAFRVPFFCPLFLQGSWLPSPFMSKLSWHLSLCVREKVRVPSYFLLTQFKVKFCFHKEALSYLSILYCTQPFSHPKASFIPHFPVSTYTYFLNIFPTFISLKSSFLKIISLHFLLALFSSLKVSVFCQSGFLLLTLNLSGNGFLTLLQKPPLW